LINDFRLTENFNLREFQCRCCGSVKIDSELVQKLQSLRDRLGKPIIVTSGYRCPRHNKEVGGVEDSYHTQGLAVDIQSAIDIDKLVSLAEEVGFKGIGIYRRLRFLHLDLGPERRWTL